MGSFLRPRFEYADYPDSSDFSEPGKAFTNRTSISFKANKTLNFDWLSSYMQVRSVNNFGYTNYSNSEAVNQYGEIDDPQQARLTGAYFDLHFSPYDSLKLGRQTLEIDDQRFIGSFNFRQMGQQFDSINAQFNYKNKYSAMLNYIWGYSSYKNQSTAYDMNSLLFHANAKLFSPLQIGAYAYLISNIHEDNSTNKDSVYLGSDTYGLRIKGEYQFLKKFKLSYRAEGAVQKDPSLKYGSIDKDLLRSLNSDFYHANISFEFYGFGLLADYQYLGNAKDSDNEDGFNTPLASLHEFQGYADAFLTTTNGSGCGIVANKNGLIDMNLSLFYSHNIWGVILLTYHDFSSIDEYTDAAVGGDMTNDLGTEIDFKYTLNIPKTKNLELLVKGAFTKVVRLCSIQKISPSIG